MSLFWGAFIICLSFPLQAIFPELPQGYDALVVVTSPLETKIYPSYNLYIVRKLCVGCHDDSAKQYTLILERLKVQVRDVLAVRNLVKKKVVLALREIPENDQYGVYRSLAITPVDAPDDPPLEVIYKSGVSVTRFTAYMGDVLKLKYD